MLLVLLVSQASPPGTPGAITAVLEVMPTLVAAGVLQHVVRVDLDAVLLRTSPMTLHTLRVDPMREPAVRATVEVL